jgi:ribosome-binding factor A
MSQRGSKLPSQRQLRVGEELRHALATIVERGELRDPDLAGHPLTVTEVRASPDLRNATVYVVPLGGGDAGPIVAALNRAKSFLRRRVAGEVRLKFAPDLKFEADTSFDQAERIEELLKSIHDDDAAQDSPEGSHGS